MAKVNATVEISSKEFLGYEICWLCPFEETRFDKKPCRCKLFNKELDRFNPVKHLSLEIYENVRLQECKNSEVE